ncbi:MAG: magnesium chelatase ATPase subunit I, partial [Deltaproteobacteria bacterium]|nr:magnesium chelatase ATPase subunit I [Deltaproteobacteria bacterium]
SIERRQLFAIADFCLEVGVDGHRADIILLKAAKALAALDGLAKVEERHVEAAAELALPHRMRRRPLMEMGDNVNKVRKLRRKAE